MTDREFRKEIYRYFKQHGRSYLPWRGETDPYKILVSEIMLQQTQANRVIPKYEAFLKRFKTPWLLAKASNSEVLSLWSGLGYNRRALNLKRAAEAIVERYNGHFPHDKHELESLPGIGPYTARAIRVFAYNQPETMIETNIRSVYIHFFFPRQKAVGDSLLLPIIERTVDRKHPRDWYGALMDYGAMLKATKPNPSRKSKHHTTQTKFKGSVREVRGSILKELVVHKTISKTKLLTRFDAPRIEKALAGLVKDKMIKFSTNGKTISVI